PSGARHCTVRNPPGRIPPAPLPWWSPCRARRPTRRPPGPWPRAGSRPSAWTVPDRSPSDSSRQCSKGAWGDIIQSESCVPLADRLVKFMVGDMLALPFPSASFDAATVGYGLRNVPDLDAAILEVSRVLKPGGRLVSLDFNRPTSPAIRALYLAYLTIVGGAL